LTKKTPTPHTGCPLCRIYEEREIITRYYYENNIVIIVDCKTCGVPMVVLKRHTDIPTAEEGQEMYNAQLNRIPKSCIKPGWWVDIAQGSTPNHAHFHLRHVE